MSNIYKHRNVVIILAVVLCVIMYSFSEFASKKEHIVVKLIDNKQVFTASDSIQISFESSLKNVALQMYIHSSYGSTVLEAFSNNSLQFKIPKLFSSKKGLLTYKVLYNTKELYTGQFVIIDDKNSSLNLETYIGPPSIVTGGNDYAMHVVVPSDRFDNTVSDSTSAILKHQFLDNKNEKQIVTKDMIVWDNVYSNQQSGRILLTSEIRNTFSKEFSVEVFPSLPQNFVIESKRHHEYADGNQLIAFQTSIIKDRYSNIISDGTLVKFTIHTDSGSVLVSNAVTINGIATAKVLHPDHKNKWRVKAAIEGMAESNTVLVDFKSAIQDFEVDFNRNNREIKVGPLLSFMNQIIPDGTLVTIDIYKGNKNIERINKATLEGVVTLSLKKPFYEPGYYTLKIKALGIEKSYNGLILK